VLRQFLTQFVVGAVAAVSKVMANKDRAFICRSILEEALFHFYIFGQSHMADVWTERMQPKGTVKEYEVQIHSLQIFKSLLRVIVRVIAEQHTLSIFFNNIDIALFTFLTYNIFSFL
jgi:hypothetical protein